jgi:hypothetical protein
MASIAAIKALDAGTKGLATEGTVVYSQARKHLQGTSEKTGKDYDFYSQFTIVEDVNKDAIAIDLGDSQEVQNGDFVRVHKGLLKDHRDKDGKATVKLSARLLVNGSQAPQKQSQDRSQSTQGGTNTEDQRAIAWNAACTVAAQSSDMSLDDIEEMAMAGAYFIANGKSRPAEKPQGGQSNPDYVGDDPPKPDGPIPF